MNLRVSINDQFELFLLALNGEYLRLTQPGVDRLQAVNELRRFIHRQGQALRARISDEVNAYVGELGLSENEARRASVGALVLGLRADVSQIITAVTNQALLALRAGRADLGKMFNRSLHGAVGELVLKKATKLDFKAPDSAGRVWDAGRLMNFTVREAIYRLTLMKQLDELPGDVGEVFNPDHPEDGMLFSKTGVTLGLPTYADIEKSVFHYNSTAEVRPYAAP